jgi:ABC-2 type transport system ATP-binding protein
VSSHLIGEVARTADHVLVIGRGRLLADTSVADLSARSASLEDSFFELTSGAADHQATPDTKARTS